MGTDTTAGTVSVTTGGVTTTLRSVDPTRGRVVTPAVPTHCPCPASSVPLSTGDTAVPSPRGPTGCGCTCGVTG